MVNALAASNRGSDRHPAWYLNLLADPDVTVQVGTQSFTARARPATAAERPHLWRLMVSAMPEYATYQERTTREIPVVLLERVQGPTTTSAANTKPTTRTNTVPQSELHHDTA